MIRRKYTVSVGNLDIKRGITPSDLRTFLQESEQQATEKGYTDFLVYAECADDHENYYKILVFQAKRPETEEEYARRLEDIEQHKIQQREEDLKQFNRLKERLGL